MTPKGTAGLREILARRKRALLGFYRESIVKNATFLLASNFVMSALGFVFWVIAARLFPKSEVGIATVVLTAASLVTSIGLLGLDSALMRFLALAEKPNEQLDSTFTLVVATTLTSGIVYISLTPVLSSHLAFLRHNMLDAGVLLAFLIVLATNAILQSTFISMRRASFVLLGNSLFSAAKLCLLPFLITFGAFGIVGAGWVAMILSLVLSLTILRRKFGLGLRLRIHWSSLRSVRVYASSLFAGGILSSLVAAAIPVIVLNRLGADQAADYYIVVSLTALLSVIASSTGLSLVAEGAHSQETLHEDVRKATLHIFSVLCPSILVYLVGGHYILSIFGRSYAQQGTALLRILALAAPFVALNYLADAIVNVRRQNGLFLIMCAFNSVLIICLSVLFVKRGLTGLGIAWLAAQALTVVVYGLVFRKELPAFVRGR